jgi:transcription initiation factor TFIIIB Brf1 subunit/transcription initiation factor TFIIB
MSDEGATKRRRARRPTEVAARLQRLRQRNADQLEAQREAERRIETALTAYVEADVSIHAVERDRDQKLAALQQQTEQVREAAREKIEQIQAQQAIAVWQLNTAGRTVEQIAELLEVPHKEARRLLSTGRTTAELDHVAAPGNSSTPSGNTAPAEQPAQPQPPPMPAGATSEASEQRDLPGVDGHQDSADATLIPPTVPDSGGQRT